MPSVRAGNKALQKALHTSLRQWFLLVPSVMLLYVVIGYHGGHLDHHTKSLQTIRTKVQFLEDRVNAAMKRDRTSALQRDSMIAEQVQAHAPVTRHIKFAVVNTADSAYLQTFAHHSASMQCYAEARGYDFISTSPRHMLSKEPLFSRHLVVMDLLPQYDWILFYDGDVQVFNYNTGLESFVQDSDSDIIFSVRFINGEVAAGAYLVRNSTWSTDFLRKWGTRSSLPFSRVGNADNGFLVQLLTQVLFVDNARGGAEHAAAAECVAVFNKSVKRGKCCFSLLMQGQRHFPHVSILRRGHPFFRDDFAGQLLFKSDLGVHNKNRWRHMLNDSTYKTAEGVCRVFEHNTVLPEMVATDSLQQYAVCVYDHIFATYAPMLGSFSPDVWECFPHCPLNLATRVQAQCVPAGQATQNYDRQRALACEGLKQTFSDQDWRLYNRTLQKDVEGLMQYIARNWGLSLLVRGR
jgi:hypothetical protein